MLNKLPLVLVGSALAVGCSSPQVKLNPDLPTWAQRGSGKCLNLPEFEISSKNLCGIGIASNITSVSLGMKDAGAKARAELAAVMKAKLKSFTREVQESLSKGGKTDEIQKVQAGVEELVSQTLVGATVPITYQDKSSGNFYAMAMVDPETFQKAMNDLKTNSSLSEAVKEEINKRADDVMNEWDRADEKASQ